MGRLAHLSSAILVKRVFESGSEVPDVAEARRQYEALVDLNHTRGSTAGFNLVQPFHLFEGQAIIVQSWIAGQSLSEVFKDRSVPVARIVDLVRSAGEWLAHFHRFGGPAQSTKVSPGLLVEIENEAKLLGKLGRRLSRATVVMKRSAVFDGTMTQPVATLHCDYKPANLIATDTGVFAIDFQFSRRASIYFDVAHFLNSTVLDLMKARRPMLLLQASRLHREFLAAYSKIAGPIDPLLLSVFLAYDLSRYISQHGEPAFWGLKGQIRRRMLGWLLDLRLSQFRRHERRRRGRLLVL